ncbi:type IV pilin protein [Ferrigenium sp. UT5]|uniref:type IV pilin protein n=1 Tax=Ferrigenium sp. UT5 TaxID=3242105 RepID=UPI00355341C6
MNKRQRGFTLIELMIVVVIIGILAAIAVPSYGSYRIKSSRAAAQTELLQLASVQEKIYLNSNAYSPNLTTAYDGNAAGGLGKTTGKTEDERYTLAFSGTPDQTFEIRAVPVAGSAQAGDGCLLIKDNGIRQWHESNDACNSASPKTW